MAAQILKWLLIAVTFCLGASAEQVRICVPNKFYEDCQEMAGEVKAVVEVQCVNGRDIMDCIYQISQNKADIVNLAPEELYAAGKNYGLQPFAVEQYRLELYRYLAVAVVHKGSNINSLKDLKGKKSCHTGVGRTAGWNIPIGVLLSKGVMEPDCDGDIASVSKFFSQSCAAGRWSPDATVDEELKKGKYQNLCKLCKKDCSTDEAFYGYEGALKCLNEGGGDIAFTKWDAVKDFFKQNPDLIQKYEYLCLDGNRQSIEDSNKPCHWAERPTNVFVYLPPSDHSETKSNNFRRFVEKIFNRPSGQTKPDWFYRAFVSSPEVTAVSPLLSDRSTWDKYLGDFKAAIEKPLGDCPKVKICVTKGPEERKCQQFKAVAFSRRIRPEIECVAVDEHSKCLKAVQTGEADIVNLDGGDLYQGGRYNKLIPVAAERYDDETGLSYYAVAVIKTSEAKDNIKLADFKGKKSCHTGLGRTAGWVIPVGRMVEDSLIPRKECDRPMAVSQFFSGSCVPGALSLSNDTSNVLCSICKGNDLGEHKCERSNEERYNGYVGAFRCLASGDGDVAFVNHKTVPANTDGNNNASWAKDLRSEDFKLVCPSGGIADVKSYEKCNLGTAPSHYVAMSPGIKDPQRLGIIQLLVSSSKTFGPSVNNTIFQLFEKFENVSNLMFKDATVTLVPTRPYSKDYKEVLGSFYKLAEDMDPIACKDAGSRFLPFGGNGLFTIVISILAVVSRMIIW